MSATEYIAALLRERYSGAAYGDPEIVGDAAGRLRAPAILAQGRGAGCGDLG